MADSGELSFTADDINAVVAEAFPTNPNRCIELGPTFAVVRYEVDASNLRPGGFVSGPTQFGMVDSALWSLTWAAIGRIEPMALTSELSIRFLRPATGSVVYCRADLDARSRRSVVGTSKVWCDDRPDKPTAVGQGTYALHLA